MVRTWSVAKDYALSRSGLMSYARTWKARSTKSVDHARQTLAESEARNDQLWISVSDIRFINYYQAHRQMFGSACVAGWLCL